MSIPRSRRRHVTTTPPSNYWSVMFASAVAGDDIEVPNGTVIFDMANSPTYGLITYQSSAAIVEVLRTMNTVWNYEAMEVGAGTYFVGDTANPFPRNSFTHTSLAHGARSADPQLAAPAGPAITSANRGITVDGGVLAWVAEVPDVVIFKLGATAEIGASSLTADTPVTLKAGDWLELGTTMYWSEGLTDLQMALLVTSGSITTPFTVYDNAGTREKPRRPGYGSERVRVASDVTASTTIPIDQAISYNDDGVLLAASATLRHRHHGTLQYVVPPALETTADNLRATPYTIQASDQFGYFDVANTLPITGTRVLAAIAGGSTNVIDNRATVGLLTHPIKFGAPNDTDWTTHGYGAHMMVMGRTSKRMLQGVERFRVGQMGFIGRYPDHDHMRSYTPYGSIGSGTYLGDVDPDYNFAIKCSTLRSSNRGIAIHGTCGLNVYQNVFADIDTHCIFLEDGSERRNVIDGNFICEVGSMRFGGQLQALFTASRSGNTMTVTAVQSGTLALDQAIRWKAGDHTQAFVGRITAFGTGSGGTGTYTISYIDTRPYFDTETSASVYATRLIKDHDGGASGIWYTNPDNYLRNNIAIGCHVGIWNTFANACFGASRDVAVVPRTMLNLEHDNNEAACALDYCMQTQPMVTNEVGTLLSGNAALAGVIAPGVETVNNLFDRVTLWKGTSGWYSNDASHPRYKRWRCSAARTVNPYATSRNLAIVGNTASTPSGGVPSFFEGGLFVTNTLDDYYPDADPALMVSYGGGMNRLNNIFVPKATTAMVKIDGRQVANNGQVMHLWDFYYYPVNNGWTKDEGNCILGADPGYLGVRWPPTYMTATNHPATSFGASYTTVTGTVPVPWSQNHAGAWKLPTNGDMHGAAGGWWVYDHPFLLHDTTGSYYVKSPAGYSNLNGKIVSSAYDYYGLRVTAVNGVFISGHTGGSSPTNEEIHYTRLQSDGTTVVDTWNTGDPDGNYPSFRYACALHGGVYTTDFPDRAAPTSISAEVYAMTPANANVIWGIEFANATTVTSATFGWGSSEGVSRHTIAAVASKAALLAATTCSRWQDTTNNRLWLKLFGGDLTNQYASDAHDTDQKWAKLLYLNIN